MKISSVVAALVGALLPSALSAQAARQPILHVSDRWEECAIQLDPSLTQPAWRQFTREVAMVTYYRPLRSAAPMGPGHVEISVVQSGIGIDDRDSAWNDTFVHPDSTHWLFEGSGLDIPGLTARAGITDRLDVGAYYTRNARANYAFAAGQVQYNVLRQASAGVDGSVRASAVRLFGPDDVNVNVYALDLVASRSFRPWSRVALAPYVAASSFLSSSHEKSAVVDLEDERVAGVHAFAGVDARLSFLRVGFEYDTGAVATRTIKVGLAF